MRRPVEVLAGRVLAVDGRPLVSLLLAIPREDWAHWSPAEADELTRRIARLLNADGGMDA